MKKPRILVVGSLVMDMIFRAKRFDAPARRSWATTLPPPPAARAQTKPCRRRASVRT